MTASRLDAIAARLEAPRPYPESLLLDGPMADIVALLEFARAVKAFTWASPNGYDPAYDHIRDLLNDLEMP